MGPKVEWDHPQSLTDHNYAAFRPTENHSTSLERSETPQNISLAAVLRYILQFQSDPISKCLTLQG